MLDGFQRLLPAAAGLADLDGRFGDGGHHQAVPAGARRLGDLLHEGNEVVKRPGGQAVYMPEFLGVGHQFVDEHHAGAAGVEELLERSAARGDALFVGLLDDVEQLGVAGLDGKLIGHLAPEGINFAAGQVGGLTRLGGVQRRAHQHGHAADGRAFQPRRLQHGAQVGEFHGGGAAAQQVVKRQHAVGLAAAKGGL